jgi:predicted transcriptional regulator
MLKELKAQHQEIARLRFEGIRPTEIAKRLDMSYQTIHSILADPLCKAYINGLSDRVSNAVVDVRRELASMNASALNTLKDILDPNEEVGIPASVKLAAAKDVLDRNGHKPVERSVTIDMHFTTEDIEEMRQRQLDLKKANQQPEITISAEQII